MYAVNVSRNEDSVLYAYHRTPDQRDSGIEGQLLRIQKVKVNNISHICFGNLTREMQ